MRTTSFTELRKNLSAALDSVAQDHEPLLITRSGEKSGAVLMSVEDFASFEETRYLLQSPRNAQRLTEAIDALNSHGGTERDLIE